MKIAEIIRLEESEQGTIGILKINKVVFCFTLEPPDRENERNISSIPTGQYVCEPYFSNRHGQTFQITDVPGRSYILFHAGNTVKHTEGCPLLGSHQDKLKGDRAVLNSGATFKRFVEAVGVGNKFHLTVSECY